MCTFVILRRPDHGQWPVLIAANRDELAGRPSLAPGRHWKDRDDIVAGFDKTAGGSWLGLNDHGVVAAILNRRGTLGPEPGKRSRGELVLDALDHADASAAADALGDIDPNAYRPFNLIVADAMDALWLRHGNDGAIRTQAIPAGLSMITAGELNDVSSPRLRRYRPLFQTASVPRPEQNDWSSWQLLMGSGASESGDPVDAMCIRTNGDYGTRSASMIALPPFADQQAIWLFADGPPDVVGFSDVSLQNGAKLTAS